MKTIKTLIPVSITVAIALLIYPIYQRLSDAIALLQLHDPYITERTKAIVAVPVLLIIALAVLVAGLVFSILSLIKDNQNENKRDD